MIYLHVQLCIPLYVDASGEAVVNKEDFYVGQLVDQTGRHRLSTSMCQKLHNGCSAPEALSPLHKDPGALKGAVRQPQQNAVPCKVCISLWTINRE